MTVRLFFKFVLVIFTSLVLAGCSSSYQETYATLEPAAPSVTTYSQEQINAHECGVIYVCVAGSVTTSEACAALEFTFNVLDLKTSAILVAGAKSYWSAVNAGTTAVEWGVNNAITGKIQYTAPVAKCLSKKPNYRIARAVFDFPKGYCSGRPIFACSSAAMTGWEIDEHNSDSTTVPGGSSGGNGYTVVCNDGWVSESGGIQGACSRHGGVSG